MQSELVLELSKIFVFVSTYDGLSLATLFAPKCLPKLIWNGFQFNLNISSCIYFAKLFAITISKGERLPDDYTCRLCLEHPEISSLRSSCNSKDEIKTPFGEKLIEYGELTISWNGIWHSSSNKLLRELRVTDISFKQVITRVLWGSHLCCKQLNTITSAYAWYSIQCLSHLR